MRVSIYQPRYFPQLHYFNRMMDSDIFVILDNAQYTKSLRQKTADGMKRMRSFQSDTPIKLSDGMYFLTIPIKHDGYTAINKTKIDYSQNWPSKHMLVIKSSYQRSLYFSFVYDALKNIFSASYLSLAELNIVTTFWAIAYLFRLPLDVTSLTLDNINTFLEKQNVIRLRKIILGSELDVERPKGLQKGTEWTTAICKKLGATEYLHGGTAQQNYMDRSYYISRGIVPVVQHWQCEPYHQQFNKHIPFISDLSILDAFFNIARERVQQLLLPTKKYYVAL